MCQREAPVLEATYKAYRKRGLVLLGVSIMQDEDQPARNFVKRYKLTYPNGRDISGTIGSLYDVKGTPTVIFVDKGGNLVERHVGAMPEDAFRQRIKDLLK
ncbi:MAG: TlpA family protein disulfide reductase [Syntrophales bacterium]